LPLRGPMIDVLWIISRLVMLVILVLNTTISNAKRKES